MTLPEQMLFHPSQSWNTATYLSEKAFIRTTTFILNLRKHTSTMLSSIRTTLDLETSRSSPTTSPLEFPSLAFDVWLLAAVWSKPEMLDSLSGILWSS